jgi:outer membrane protein TolC
MTCSPRSRWMAAAAGVLCASASIGAQTSAAPGDPVRLDTLQRAAIDTDPRTRELALLQAQTALRLGNLAVERLPSVAAEGQAQYQSDVPQPPALVPGGAPLFAPPKDTYDAHLRIDQRVFDPTRRPRTDLARAELLESQARVRAALFAVRQEVNDAFFGAALFQERAAATAAAIADLEARLGETNTRVREGTALPADAAAVEAALLQRRQDHDEVTASRRAALSRLASLTGRPFDDRQTLALPDLDNLGEAVAAARRAPGDVRARPEYEQFARTRDRLARQQDVAAAHDRPSLAAFARVGYGRPGLNFISDRFETYGVAGLDLRWNAWTWGTADREGQALGLQREIAAAEEAAFTRTIGRSTDTDATAIDRLQQAVALDDRIVALREEVVRATELRFREGLVTASEYVDRTTELLGARVGRAAHRVELAQAGARLLTTLGLEVSQ